MKDYHTAHHILIAYIASTYILTEQNDRFIELLNTLHREHEYIAEWMYGGAIYQEYLQLILAFPTTIATLLDPLTQQQQQQLTLVRQQMKQLVNKIRQKKSSRSAAGLIVIQQTEEQRVLERVAFNEMIGALDWLIGGISTAISVDSSNGNNSSAE